MNENNGKILGMRRRKENTQKIDTKTQSKQKIIHTHQQRVKLPRNINAARLGKSFGNILYRLYFFFEFRQYHLECKQKFACHDHHFEWKDYNINQLIE